jgi:8-oxo-dGTP diphosphatase
LKRVDFLCTRRDSFLAPTRTTVIVSYMKSRRKQRLDTVNAAGGILVMAHRPPLVAIVQRRKDNGWVLPKGKLKTHETAFAAAQREVTEETGHRVVVHDYLGAVSYQAGNRPKVVQFWRMSASSQTPRKPMSDIKAMKWLPLRDAIARLSHPLERAFLAQIGQQGLKPLSSRQLPSPRSKLRTAPVLAKLRHQAVIASASPTASRESAKHSGIIRRFLQLLQDAPRAKTPLS